jgi:glycosyltransferase involved in cell wall biosynthesis
MKKLLLVHRYIRPDAPGYAHMLYIMGSHFAQQGHDVTIFSAQPGYNDAYQGEKPPTVEFADGMKIIRIPLLPETKRQPLRRAINVLIFCVRLFFHALFQRQSYDLMTVSTFPPTVMGLVARAIGWFRGTGYVYHCMDLYPEVAQASGLLKRKWLARLAEKIDTRNCQKARSVVLLSDDMVETVRKRGVVGDHLSVINNFIIDPLDPDATAPDSLQNNNQKFRVLFAGNIGRFQGLDVIVEAARLLKQYDDVEFWFVGGGAMVDSLKDQAGELLDRSVFFHPYVPIDQVMSVIATAHLGLVSLTPGVIGCAYPSKTMSYLEAGCKLLVMVEPDSQLATMVKSESVGVVCADADPRHVAEAIESELNQWKNETYCRDSIQAAGRRLFGQQVILGRWTRLLESLQRS